MQNLQSMLAALSPTTIIIIAVVAVIVVAIVIWFVVSRNGLVRVRNDAEEAYSTMDVYMKKRYDLIPNLVETCKGYAKFESSTLEKVVEARSLAMSSTGADKALAEKELGASLKTLLNVVHEQYPDLKASTQFSNLSRQLESVEQDIAQSRKYYNAKVKLFNNKIEMFPSSLVAGSMHLERKPFFEIDETERATVKVSFDDSPKTRL